MPRARVAAVGILVLALASLVGAGPAVAAGTTTTSTSSTTSTTSTTAGKAAPTSTTKPPAPTTSLVLPTTTVPPVAPNTGQSDLPPGEEELIGLLDNVHTRLATLQAQLSSLDTELATNRTALQADTAALVARQAAAYDSDRRVVALEVDRAAARLAMRKRAVAAYMHQPTDDLATMLLHLGDPADLVDARQFYATLVDTQVRAVKQFDSLGHAARGAAKAADTARDAAAKLQQKVATQTQALTALQATLQEVQQESLRQQQQQTQLLSQVGTNNPQFAAEVALQAQESAEIEQLLAALSTSGGTTATPSAGYFTWPVPGAPITSPFGPRVDPIAGYLGFHPGLDFGAAMGTPIHAAGDGLVVFAGQESGYGNYTSIDHGSNIATCYGHQSVLLVQVGQQVTRGQVIGLVGSTGYSTGPHLHFEVRIRGAVTDPLPWLTGQASVTTTTTR